MMELLAPALFAMFVWWFSTGAILYLDGRPRHTFAWTMIGASFLLALALIGMLRLAGTATPAAAYWSFTCGLICWGWQEVTLYLGYITGPRRTGLAEHARGWTRLRMAIASIIYHEAAIFVMGALIAYATLGAANTIGMWTYRILPWSIISGMASMTRSCSVSRRAIVPVPACEFTS